MGSICDNLVFNQKPQKSISPSKPGAGNQTVTILLVASHTKMRLTSGLLGVGPLIPVLIFFLRFFYWMPVTDFTDEKNADCTAGK